MKLQLLYFLLFIPGLSFSQNDNCEICKSILVQDYFQLTHNKETDYSYLSIINEETYKLQSTQAGLSFIIPFYGIAAGTDYNSFDEGRRKYFENVKYDYKSIDHLSVLKKALN